MKFLEFLNEETISNEKITEIKKNCSKFFKETKYNYPLLRGFGRHELSFYELNANRNRKPLNLSIESHTFINDSFKNVFKKPLRSICTFATGDFEEAISYGNVFYFIPSGNFEVYWSQYVHDLLMITQWSTNIVHSKLYFELLIFCLFFYYYESKKFAFINTIKTNFALFKYHEIIDSTKEMNIEQIIKKLKPFKEKAMIAWATEFYEKGNLQDAIESENEIMVDCEKYYIINYKEKQIWKELWGK